MYEMFLVLGLVAGMALIDRVIWLAVDWWEDRR